MNNEMETQPTNSSDHKHRRSIYWLLGLGLIILVALLAMGIIPRVKRNASLAQGVQQAKSSVPEVVIVKPKRVSDKGLSLPGDIEAIQETTLNGRTTGYLRYLYVDIGSHVKAGQVLAEIQAPDTDQQAFQATAQTAQSRAVVSESQADVNRQKASLAQSQAEVTRQHAAVQQAQAQEAGSVASLEQAQAVEEGAEAALAHAVQALGVQQATLKQQEAQRDLAKVTYTRYQNLVSQGFDSQQDLDQAQATLKTNEAGVTSSEASIKLAEADVNSAQKAIQAAKHAVDSAVTNVQANKKNVQANIAELTSMQAAMRYAVQSVRVSQATVAANQAGVTSNVANERRYAVMQAYEKVIAPFDGVVTSRNVDIGALIVGDNAASGASTGSTSAVVSNNSTAVAGSGMLGIARTDIVRIQVSVPQTYVPALKSGSKAQVTIRELPRKKFKGTVTLRAGAMDTASRTQLVEVHLANPGGILVPGMYAQVQIVPAHPPMTLQVPGTALIVDSNGTRVGVVLPDKTVHMQSVVIGRDFGTTVEILSGLKGNENLVNNPSDLLQDNDKVQISTPAPGGAKGGARHKSGGD